MFKSRCGYAFTPIAEQDLDQIFEYISIDLSSPIAAEKLIDNTIVVMRVLYGGMYYQSILE